MQNQLINNLIKLGSIILVLIASPYSLAEEAGATITQGKEITFDRKKGNCLACHMVDDGELPGALGPPLINMQARFPDKAKLREQIWDATIRNPMTSMPPFGKHRMLTEEEIDKVVEYIYTL